MADEELPAKLCRIVDKSQALNVTAQQKWPLLRASNSGLYKCELCEFNRKYYSDLKQVYDLEAQVCWFKRVSSMQREFLYQHALIEHAKLQEEDPTFINTVIRQ